MDGVSQKSAENERVVREADGNGDLRSACVHSVYAVCGPRLVDVRSIVATPQQKSSGKVHESRRTVAFVYCCGRSRRDRRSWQELSSSLVDARSGTRPARTWRSRERPCREHQPSTSSLAFQCISGSCKHATRLARGPCRSSQRASHLAGRTNIKLSIRPTLRPSTTHHTNSKSTYRASMQCQSTRTEQNHQNTSSGTSNIDTGRLLSNRQPLIHACYASLHDSPQRCVNLVCPQPCVFHVGIQAKYQPRNDPQYIQEQRVV